MVRLNYNTGRVILQIIPVHPQSHVLVTARLDPMMTYTREEARFHYIELNSTCSTFSLLCLQTWSGSLELVAKEDKPYLLIEVRSAGGVEKWEFVVFDPVTPPDSTFSIPSGCPQDSLPPTPKT